MILAGAVVVAVFAAVIALGVWILERSTRNLHKK